MAMGRSLRKEERIGLGVAIGLHVLLVLAFLLQPAKREAIEPTQRMTVNLASEVGMEATAPEPVPESRAAMAPTLVRSRSIRHAGRGRRRKSNPNRSPQPKLNHPVRFAKQPTPPDTRERRRPDKPSPAAEKPARRAERSASLRRSVCWRG